MTEKELERKIVTLASRLRLFARKLLGDDTYVDDVIQNVLLKTWKQLSSGMSILNMEAFLMRSIRNECLDWNKSFHSKHIAATEDITRNETAGKNLEDTIQEKDAVQKLGEYMMDIPENQRCAIVLKDYMGYDTKEIALMMGTSEDAVRQALSRGRKELRNRFIKEV